MKEEEIKVTDGETVENEQDKNVTDTVDNEQGDVDINENTDTAEQENDADEADSANMSEEKSPLEVANEEIAALKDKYLRTVAEFKNYKMEVNSYFLFIFSDSYRKQESKSR